MSLFEPSSPPPHWEAFLARLASLDDPHLLHGAAVEYLQAVFPEAEVGYLPPALWLLAGSEPRWFERTEAARLEGFPLPSGSALLDRLFLVSSDASPLEESGRGWLREVSRRLGKEVRRAEASPLDRGDHPVTRLGGEAFFHHCLNELARQPKTIFHGLFFSVDGFARRWPGAEGPAGEALLRNMVVLLRHAHVPRSALFHLSHAFFAVLTTGQSRRAYRRAVWELRRQALAKRVLPNRRLNLSMAVISWPTDACFAGSFADLLLCSLNKARRQGGHSVIFTEDWYRNPFRR